MNRTLATLGLLGAAGALSLCDLCGSGRWAAAARDGLVATAHAATVPAPGPAQPPARPAAVPRTIAFAVEGMTCGGCVLATRKVLTRLPGVTRADVSYEKGTAVVTYDPEKVTVEQMVAAIRTLGYTATPRPATGG